MRRWISFLGHLTIITILTSFAYNGGKAGNALVVPEELQTAANTTFTVAAEVGNAPVVTQDFSLVQLDNDFLGFKEALAFKESQGKYTTVNTLGYLGKYQFGRGTLLLMGVDNTDVFLNDPILQEQVFRLNISRNKWILRRDIKRFVGKRINGITITESGIVAAAHLAGAGNVKKYLRSYGQQDFSDAYGSTVAYYMQKFSGFDLSDIEAIHNPKV